MSNKGATNAHVALTAPRRNDPVADTFSGLPCRVGAPLCKGHFVKLLTPSAGRVRAAQLSPLSTTRFDRCNSHRDFGDIPPARGIRAAPMPGLATSAGMTPSRRRPQSVANATAQPNFRQNSPLQFDCWMHRFANNLGACIEAPALH
jgi:hypothetical protein